VRDGGVHMIQMTSHPGGRPGHAEK
jgi:hypothetical protein